MCGLVLWFVAPATWGRRSWAFRDAGHFYYPSWLWLDQQRQHGGAAAWNPQINLGAPVVGETTLGVFYPGQWLLRLPLPYPDRFRLYLQSHLLLAALTAYWVCRRWALSRCRAALAGASYAAGGSVLFLLYNPPYLISAAWLPAALYAVENVVRRQGGRPIAGLAAVLSLQILGGDPQTAYHVVLAGLLLAGLAPRSAPHALPWPLPRRWARIGAAAVAAAALCAVQLWPAHVSVRESDRAVFDAPRSLYELPRWWARDHLQPLSTAARWRQLAQGFLGRASPASHDSATYDFSVPPWQFIECFFPNCGGRLFPQNHRWLQALPAAGRMWTPTCYLGLAPLLLALLQLRFRSGPHHHELSLQAKHERARWRDVRRRWLSWLAILALLASWGWYGLGVLIQECSWTLLGRDAWMGPQVGGPYWILTWLAPGYCWFRYPAKWLPLWALSISFLAAGCQGVRCLTRSRTWKWLTLGSVSLLVVAWWLGPSLLGRLSQWPLADPTWGAWSERGAHNDMCWGLAQAAVVCGLITALGPRLPSRLVWPMCLFVSVLDLAVAHRDLLPTASDASLRVHAWFASDKPQPDAPRIWKNRAPDWPAEGAEVGSDGWVARERAALIGRYHLLVQPACSLVGAFESAPSAAWVAWKQEANDPRWAPWLGCQWSLAAATPSQPPRVRPVQPPGQRVWLARRVEVLPALPTSCSREDMHQRTRDVLDRLASAADPSELAVVEDDGLFVGQTQSWDQGDANGSWSRIVAASTDAVSVEARLQSPAILVLASQLRGGWSAQLASSKNRLPIVRVNRLLQGVALPAGEWQVQFVYTAPGAVWGWRLSWCTAAVLVCVAFGGWMRGAMERFGPAAARREPRPPV